MPIRANLIRDRCIVKHRRRSRQETRCMMGIEILKNGGGGVSWRRGSETQRKSNQKAKHRREGKQIDKLEQASWTREGNVRRRQAGQDKLHQTSCSREGNVTHRRKVIR